MFLIGNIAEALEKIRATIQETLGPLFNTTNLTVDRLTQYGIDFGIQIGATILLFIIVAIFFWKPITKILEKRREVIDKELKKARKSEKTISNDGCLMKIVKAPFRFLWWLIKKTFVILSLGLLSGVLNSDKK